MSEMFQSYEQDFVRLLNKARTTVSSFPADPAQKERMVVDIKRELAEAEKCVRLMQLRQMEIEVSMMPVASRSHLQITVRKYREDIDKMNREIRGQEREISDKRNYNTLMGSRIDAVTSMQDSNPRNAKLLGAQQMMIDQGLKLDQGKRLALEAEGVAIDTMNNLKMQREQIYRTSNNVREIGENLGKSNRLITTMTRRAMTNKLTMIGIIALLVLAICVVFYLKIS
jgi:vesicle transport through interaction with t-SNAREs protein 1